MSEWVPPPALGEAVAAGVAAPLAAFDSLHRVEGAALALLCATDVEVSHCVGNNVRHVLGCLVHPNRSMLSVVLVLQVRRLGLEVLRTARELHRTLAAPPRPSSKRATLHHVSAAGEGVLEAAARRASMQSAAAGGEGTGLGSRRSSAMHGAASSSGGDHFGVPAGAFEAGGPRVVYAADIIDRSARAGAGARVGAFLVLQATANVLPCCCALSQSPSFPYPFCGAGAAPRWWPAATGTLGAAPTCGDRGARCRPRAAAAPRWRPA